MSARGTEIQRYADLYARHGAEYCMTEERLSVFRRLLLESPRRGSILDVGAGHGDMLRVAGELGYAPTLGTEVVGQLLGPSTVYAEAHDLPFESGSFGTVACFDVLEHLLPADVPEALAELCRVARDRILVEVSCRPSNWRDERGQLHMTIWTPERWEGVVAAIWAPEFLTVSRPGESHEDAAVVFEGVRLR